MSLHMACQHGAAADEHRGYVDSGCGHQQAGHVLITVGHHHQGVELMGDGHTLGRVGNQVPCYQRILHADMAHGNAVADRNGRENHRGSSRHGHAQLDGFHDFIQVHMTRHNLVIGTDDSHQRLFHLLLGHSQCVKQGPVGCLLHTGFYCITLHFVSSYLFTTARPRFIAVPGLGVFLFTSALQFAPRSCLPSPLYRCGCSPRT